MDTLAPPAAARDLLAWYDRHRRVLPWRAQPGEVVDPYRVWLSEIMLQQTTVKAVIPYFASFLARWPTVTDLASAPVDEVMKAWAGLGYYSRARNLHACAKAVVDRHDGRFPDTVAGLRALPGIGDYTAAAIAAIAFGRPAAVVDGNVERVIARLEAMETPVTKAKPAIRARVAALLDPMRPGDFAQATMDLGATLCTPKSPACGLCPWRLACKAAATGEQMRFPVKPAKNTGVPRTGAAFVITRGDEVLIGQRAARGLLGGMAEVPGTVWGAGDATDLSAEAPFGVSLTRVPGAVTHVFTHFPLTLEVYRGDVPSGTPAPEGLRWVARGALDGEALAQVFRKVLAHAFGETVQRGPARAMR